MTDPDGSGSGKDYRFDGDIDDVMDAVDGEYTQPLARSIVFSR